MYSGQQKSPTSSDEPAPGPPPVDSPNPWPRTPVSAHRRCPGLVCAPRVGVRPRASSGACFTTGAGVDRVGLASGSGTVISGVFAAGGRTGSRRASSSGGVVVCTGRPPSGVMPPTSGPWPAAAKRDRHHRASAALRCVQDAAGRRRSATAASTRCADTEAEIIRCSPAGVCMRSRRTSLTSVISSSRRSRYRLAGILATMPMFWTPAAFSISITSIRS